MSEKKYSGHEKARLIAKLKRYKNYYNLAWDDIAYELGTYKKTVLRWYKRKYAVNDTEKRRGIPRIGFVYCRKIEEFLQKVGFTQ